MIFELSGRDVNVTDAIRNYARNKSSRLHRYYDRIQAIEGVIARHDHHAMIVELIVDVPHAGPFVASHVSDDLYEAIDAVVDKLERQLTDHKQKLRNRKHIA
jgi:putative sigma-54 modulation protein